SPSAAGPASPDEPAGLPAGPPLPPLAQALRFSVRPMAFQLSAARRYGDVWTMRIPMRRGGFVVTSHPDHVRSLMSADPADAPSLTGESPLRPILGPNSVLTSVGERHLRQRKLLLPAFHGEAVARYVEMIAEVAERDIDGWPIGEPFPLAPRMQAVTLEVIMRGVLGIEPGAAADMPEELLRQTVRRLLAASTHPAYRLLELRNAGRSEARGLLARMIARVDRRLYAVIARRRLEAASPGHRERDDVLSMLLAARDDDGEPLTDRELRDELLSLVLAGHETTANSLAWTFERLLRTPAAYGRLRELARGDDEAAAAAFVEATIHEGMRARPVIPMVVRLVERPWRLGPHVLPAGTATAVGIIALHHRPDVYPRPSSFEPERFLAQRQPDDSGGERLDEAGCRVFARPGTYTWLPFGGGIRRCLGATLALAEQRVVLRAIARRVDLVAPSPAPEPPRMRNVTMIPRDGCLVRVAHRRAG
ncbi:MAG: cytochrome P450, partial [Solirubrobacteraceae bacterium]